MKQGKDHSHTGIGREGTTHTGIGRETGNSGTAHTGIGRKIGKQSMLIVPLMSMTSINKYKPGNGFSSCLCVRTL